MGESENIACRFSKESRVNPVYGQKQQIEVKRHPQAPATVGLRYPLTAAFILLIESLPVIITVG